MAPPWLDVLDDTIRACSAHHRPDLASGLRHRRAQLLDPKLRVVVLGEPNQGKSQLINALVNAPVCAVGDEATTTAPAVVGHAKNPTATIVAGPETGQRSIEGSVDRVPVEAVSAQANLRAAAAPGHPVRAEIGLPRTLLATGLVLIDTPGVTDPTAPNSATALSVLPEADAVLMISDATRELTATELDLLGRVARLCPSIVVVLTKIDIVPSWREVAERDRESLAAARLPTTVLPVSAALRLTAARTGDNALNEESGFAELIRFLHHDLLGQADMLTRRSVAAVSAMTVDELTGPLQEEFTATQRPDNGDALARWHAAGRRMEELQRESARWQTVLADEVSDLLSDVEFDLRDRTRRIVQELEEYFHTADPARSWPEFEEWLQENLTLVAETNFAWLLDLFEWIEQEIERQVAPYQRGMRSDPPQPETPLEHVGELRMPNLERFTIGHKLFAGLRGSYTGLLMFGLATTIAGMPLINPISIGAGAAFGVKSVFEERGTRLKRRQAMAKTSAQRHVDDFFLGYGKSSKDATRMLHRVLRNRFVGIAEQLRAEIAQSAKAIKRVIDTETAQRTTRAHELRTGIEELSALRKRIQAMGTVRGMITAPPRGLTA